MNQTKHLYYYAQISCWRSLRRNLEGKHTPACTYTPAHTHSGKPWTAGVPKSRSCQHRQGGWTLDRPVRRPSSCDRRCWMKTWVAICMNAAGWGATVKTGSDERDAQTVPLSCWKVTQGWTQTKSSCGTDFWNSSSATINSACWWRPGDEAESLKLWDYPAHHPQMFNVIFSSKLYFIIRII